MPVPECWHCREPMSPRKRADLCSCLRFDRRKLVMVAKADCPLCGGSGHESETTWYRCVRCGEKSDSLQG